MSNGRHNVLTIFPVTSGSPVTSCVQDLKHAPTFEI